MSDTTTRSGRAGLADNAKSIGQRLWNDFKAFSPGQKAATIAAVVALVIGGYLLMTWKSATEYAPLYTNLASSDASAIVDKLNSTGVPYKLGAAGTEILVPKDKVYATRIAMSGAGLPNSSQTGYSLLDKEGVTTSEFQQQVDYQRAIEGELANTIMAINGVSAASVHLAIPQQDVFNDGSQKPTAAVMVTTEGGNTLTSSQVRSIVYLVSSSVPNMSSDNVTVTDSAGNVLAAPGQDLGSGSGTQAEMTQAYDQQQASQLQAMIDKAIGPGHAQVTVNAVLDFSKTSTTKNSYVYDKNAPPLSESDTLETYSGTGSPGGTVGSSVTDTTATTGTTATGANGQYKKSSRTVNNALGTVTQTTQNAPGQVQKLNIAVLVDKSAKNLDIGAITNLARSSTGYDATRGDSLSVQAMNFDDSATQQAAAAAAAAKKAAAAKAAHAQLMSLVKQGVLVALIAALVVGAWLASRKRRQQPDEPIEDELGPDGPEPTPPARSGEDKYVLNSEAARTQRSLGEVADNRPADVARVLSSWLNSTPSSKEI